MPVKLNMIRTYLFPGCPGLQLGFKCLLLLPLSLFLRLLNDEQLLFLLLKHHLQRLFIKFSVALDHELFELHEVLHRHHLQHYLFVVRVRLGLIECA